MYITFKIFGGQGQCFIRLCPDCWIGTECEDFLFFYQDAVQATCTAIEALAKKHGKAKMVDAIRLPPPDLYKHVKVCCFCCCFARMGFCSVQKQLVSVHRNLLVRN